MIKRITELSLSKRIATFRIMFGIIWAIDAAFKFEPAFYRGLLAFIQAKGAGEPGWLNFWFHGWNRIIGVNPMFFAITVLVIEVLIALSLLLGVARRLNYALAIPFCFLIWGVGESFGGPYVAGTTDINAGFIYVMVFLLLYAADGLATPSWSLDPLIQKHIKWWSKIANPPSLIKSSSTKKS
jgi:thiosulfate dehydrogenase [quinone] large subunit